MDSENSSGEKDNGKHSLDDLKKLNIPLWNIDDFALEYLNEGFFGTVYKAFHKPSNELLVLKNIKEQADLEHVESFIQEVSLLCRLNHPNVLKIKGITFQNECILCCLSEYIDGGNLQDFLSKNKGNEMSLLYLNISLDISRGMNYLHGEGVIHRDLNSKNILLREIRKDRYEAIIIDFGLSYQQQDFEETPSGPIGATFHIAPELFKGDHCSRKTDVFSFGIILCEMISGCPGALPDELPRSNDFGLNVEEFIEMVSDCPAEFLDLAVRCCQVNPKFRPHFSDIVKIVDIIIDHCIEQSFEHTESVIITPRANDISITARGHDEYIVDHCLLCQCFKEEVDPLNLSSHMESIGFKKSFDRLGGLRRTGTRKLMRKYFKRCIRCGGRVLNLNHDDNDAQDIDNSVDESEQIHSSPVRIPNIVVDNIDVENHEESADSYQAGSLLRKMNSDISIRTSQLVQHTPGRLPRFFSTIMRKRKNCRKNKNNEKTALRLSWYKLLHFSSNTTTNELHKESDVSSHSLHQFKRRSCKLDIHSADYEERRLSMPFTNRTCASGPTSPTHENPNKSLNSFGDLKLEDNLRPHSLKNGKKVDAQKRNSLRKRSKSLINLLLKKGDTGS